MKFTIGTRGSKLALWQARHVASLIESEHNNVHVELRVIKTQGDKILDVPLARIGSKGLFTKEIEDALLEGSVDLAVHSMKDLPTDLPAGLVIPAILKREDARDVLISADGRTLKDLGKGDRIGTSSLRRRAFLLNAFPHLEIVSIRGNVDTRLRKLHTENLAGVILAAAGVKRMGFADQISEYLPIEIMVPATSQGALALEARENDAATAEVVSFLHHPSTAQCVGVERAFLGRMGGGCQVPIAAHCRRGPHGLEVHGAVIHPDGLPSIRRSIVCREATPEVGTALANTLLAEGADRILAQVFSAEPSL